MGKDKLNHRNKSKKAKEYKELDISEFSDIIKGKRPKHYKKDRTLLDKEREERGEYRDKKDYRHKGKYKGNKPRRP